ncbi:class I SAM-dependent methyltransferase [Leptolyngbya sp. FACHB-36]|nr:class I SAM-dependent methyltransferase [Leptolyngbya sp. FACHB-36]
MPAQTGIDGSLSDVDHLSRYALVSPFVKQKRVLDISCGSGYGTRYLALQGADQVVGVDVDAAAIQFASKFYQHPAASFIQSDAHHVQSLSDSSFDVIVSFETIEHLDYPRDFLVELRRLLKPGGQLFISCPNDYRSAPGISEYHLHKFRLTEFRDLFLTVFNEGIFLGQHLTVASCIMKPWSPSLEEVEFKAHRHPLPADFFGSQYLEHISSIENADNYIAVHGVDTSLVSNQASISQNAYQRLMNDLLYATEKISELERLRSEVHHLQAELEKAQVISSTTQQRVEAMQTSKFWKLRERWFQVKQRMGLSAID